MMRLTLRKAASLIQKTYGVKLSHSYLSLIERGRIKSIGADLRSALLDFFQITPEESGVAEQSHSLAPAPGMTVRRIPLYGKDGIETYLDIAGPELADFAVAADSDRPEMGIFSGDILVCRKAEPSGGELAVTKKGGDFCYSFYHGEKPPGPIGTVALILKKSVKEQYHEAVLNAAADQLSEERIIAELARRTGLKRIDILRSLAVLKKFSADKGTGDGDDEKNS
jgi:transcriptional regulator with XRE-family HTH domain